MGLLLVTNITRGFLVNDTILKNRETQRNKAKQSTENAISKIMSRIKIQNDLNKRLEISWRKKCADPGATDLELKNILTDRWNCKQRIALLTTNLNKLKDNERELDLSEIQDIVTGSEVHMFKQASVSTDGHEQLVRMVETSRDLRDERRGEVSELNDLLLDNESNNDHNSGGSYGGDVQSRLDFIRENMTQRKETAALNLAEILPTPLKESDRNPSFPADRGCAEKSLFGQIMSVGDPGVQKEDDSDDLSFHYGSTSYYYDSDETDIHSRSLPRKSHMSRPRILSSSSDDES